MFLEFDFVGGPSIQNTPILTFDFHPSRDLPGPRGTRGALGVRRIKKLHKTENFYLYTLCKIKSKLLQ